MLKRIDNKRRSKRKDKNSKLYNNVNKSYKKLPWKKDRFVIGDIRESF